MKAPIGVGLVGFGLAGRLFHWPYIRAAGLEVRAIITRREADVMAAMPRADVIVPDLPALLGHKDIDLVVIAIPNALHYEQARAALQAGKHVVIDKPVTPTSKEARELAALADERGLIAAGYHNRRWDSDYLTMRKLIADGAIGTPTRYITSWNRHAALRRDVWRERPGPAAGILYDLGPHLIDQALQMFGRPDWLQAGLYHQRDGDVSQVLPDDGFHLHMGKGRMSITLESSSLAAGPARTIQLDGTKASFTKAGGDVQVAQLLTGMVKVGDPEYGVEGYDQWGRLWQPNGTSEIVPSERGSNVEFYVQMARAISEGAPNPVPLCEAADTIEIIELAFESARTGTRVTLQEEQLRLRAPA